MFVLSENQDQLSMRAVTATNARRMDRDEVYEKMDALIATTHATGLRVDKLILLFEYGGRYAPLEAAELLADQSGDR